MVVLQEKDKNGNIIDEEHDSGYKEYNTYSDTNKLIRSEQHYPHGQVEIEKYSVD